MLLDCKLWGDAQIELPYVKENKILNVFQLDCEKKKMPWPQVVNNLKLSCTSWTVHNVFNSDERAKYVKLKPCPPLTRHKLAPLQFAKKYVLFRDKGKEVFSDPPHPQWSLWVYEVLA